MLTFAFISLGAPLMLLGIAAIALPIAAHLMSRRTRQHIIFPTIRLLMESRATQSNLYRVRRWILLLLRCLALIMIAMAFAMPSCTPQRTIEPDSQSKTGGAAVIFLIDTSASMQRDPKSTGGTSLLHSMQAIAQRSLASLEPGLDRVNIVFAQAKPFALFQSPAGKPILSTNHAAIEQSLGSIELTAERADLRGALAMAGQLLSEAQNVSQRRLVILSDMQQSNWKEVEHAADGTSILPKGTVVTLLPLKIEDASNVALSESRSEPAMVIVNQQALLITKVTNHSSSGRDVAIAAQLDGQPIGVRTIALAARESREVSFETTMTTQGRHRVEFSLTNDALELDNKHYLSVEAMQRMQVVVAGDDDPAALGSASYFIARALSPRGDASDLIEVRHLLSLDLAQADLSRAQALVISDVAELSPAASDAVASYLHQGGGVLLFTGIASAPALFTSLQDASDRFVKSQDAAANPAGATLPIMPWKPTQLRDFSSSPQPMRITSGTWNSPVLTEFDESARQTLSQIRFHLAWAVEQSNPLASELLRYNDNTPALSLMNIGTGRLIVANFSPSLQASDLGKYGSFVALSHSIMRHLRPRLDSRSMATVCQPVFASVPIPVGEQPGAIVIEGPGGSTMTPQLSRSDSRMSVMLPRTKAPGFYRVLRNDQTVGEVAVNIDTRESDLRTLDASAMTTLFKNDNITIDVQSAQAASDGLDLRGQPLWHWFIIAAMGFIAVELALLTVWNR